MYLKFFVSFALTALSLKSLASDIKAFDAKVKLNEFNKTQEQKVIKALEVIKKVVHSSQFKERVLNFNYGGVKGFRHSENKSNEEIYQMILDGAEILNPVKNSQMDLELILYYEPANTIGYTYPNVERIWINTKYFDRFNTAQVADNLFHEWLHKLGFKHETEFTPSRKYSVPYAVGYLIKELATPYL